MAHRLGTVFLCCAALLVITLSAQDRQIGGVGITIYEDINFKGRNATVRDAIPDLTRSGLFRQISSLRVTPGELWEGCEDRQLPGALPGVFSLRVRFAQSDLERPDRVVAPSTRWELDRGEYRREASMIFVRHSLIGISIVLCATLVSAAHSAIAQGVVMQRNVSLSMAKAIAEATVAECKSKGFNTSAVVVDRAGQVLVILRDESASPQTTEMARRKAYTARMFRTTTLEFQKRTANDPALAPQRDVADILALGGGVPIQIGTETIGGVGSSGSSQETDDACAKAGVAKVADLLK
jgi:uncharacterized protein GlcG (DUF336 family)